MAEPTPDVEADPTPEEAQLQSHSCNDTAGRPVQASTRRMPPAGQTRGIRWLLSFAGPGLITGAADDDPSGIATYVQTGAQFGYGQLWTALFVLPLMTAVQEASARVGAVTGKGLTAVMREQYSPWLAYPIVLLLLIANTINIGADIGAMAESAGLIVPLPFIVLALIFTISIAAREIFTPYARYVKILRWLAVSLLAYPITVFIVHEPSYGQSRSEAAARSPVAGSGDPGDTETARPVSAVFISPCDHDRFPRLHDLGATSTSNLQAVQGESGPTVAADRWAQSAGCRKF